MSRALTSEMPAKDRPLSEEYRMAAKAWVDLDGAARLLEETKTAVLSQKMKQQGDMPVSKAELIVKASPEWADFIARMCKARTDANLAKVKLEWVRMRFSEWQALDASARAEMKLQRYG
jgi:hypothetical protein